MNLTYKSWLSCVCVALILAGVLAPMQAATRTWDNGGGDGLWSTAANWSGDTRPTNADDVVFDATNTANCLVDSNAAWATLTTTTGYTGTINFGASIDTAYGNTRFSAATTITAGTSKLVFANTSAAVCSLGNPANQRLYDVAHTGSGALTLKTSSGKAYIDGDFTRTGGGALTLACGLQYADDLLIDGTGNITLPADTLLGTSAGGQLHIGSTVGTVSSANTALKFNGASMTFDDDKQITIGGFITGNSASVNSSGTRTTTVSGNTVLLRMNGNGKISTVSTSGFGVRFTGNQGTAVFGENDTLSGTGGAFGFVLANSNIKVSIPSIFYNGTGAVSFTDNGPRTDCKLTFTGHQNYGSGSLKIHFYYNGSKNDTIDFNGYNVTAGNVSIGCQNVPDTAVILYRDGTFTFASHIDSLLASDGSNGGQIKHIRAGSTEYISGNFHAGRTHYYNGGGAVIFNSSSTQELITNNQFNVDSISHVGSGALTVTGNLSVGSFTRTGSGNLTLGKTTYSRDLLIDGTGNLTLPNDTLHGTGAGGQYHVGSTVGTVSATDTKLRFSGSAMTFDNDRVAMYKHITINKEVTLTSTGSASSTGFGLAVATGCILLDTGAVLVNNGNEIRLYTHGHTPWLLRDTTAKIEGNKPIIVSAEYTNSKVKVGYLKYRGTSSITLTCLGSFQVPTPAWLSLVGNLDLGSTSNLIIYLHHNLTNRLIFNDSSKTIICDTLRYGCRYAPQTLEMKFTGTHYVNAIDAVTYNTGNMYDTMSTAVFNVEKSVRIGSNHNVFPGTSIWNITGTSNITSNGKQFADSLACTGSGTVSLADNLTCGALRVSSGTLNISGDSVYCARYAGVATGAALTTDASSRLRLGDGARLDMGGKNWPPTWFAGSARIYDGGTFANLYMAGSGDSLMFEPAKRYTFTAFDRDNVKGSNGTTGKNYWVSQTPTQRDTIDLPSNVTLVNFYIRDQVFLDTVTCRRADSCYSGGGGY